MDYIKYNREERDICAHLFRLLLDDQPNWGPLKAFLKTDNVDNPRVFCEVALIRDAYKERTKTEDYMSLMNSLVEIVADQEGVKDYTKFDALDQKLRDPKTTHPKQIAYKMKNDGFDFTKNDLSVYGSIQGMFNAKPDLVVCEGDNIYVYEAKFTLGFDEIQLKRTKEIAEVWQKLLYSDLGFDSEPKTQVRTLGLKKFNPTISWEEVYDIAIQFWDQNDFSVSVISKVLNL